LAGITAGYLLSTRSELQVHVFEKADKIGVDAASTKVTVFKDGKSVDVGIDVPMRSIDAGMLLGLND
jgi:predicted NAD/FAD-binding protein